MTPPPLRDYQRLAVSFLRANPRSGLFLDMGLGKTASVLSALRPEDLPVLVSAPKRVALEVWPVETPKWRPDLTVAVAVGTPAARERALNSGADVVVIGRDVMADAIPHAARFRTLVLDELSGFKSRTSARWRNARRIVNAMPEDRRVWGLTGTPAPQSLLDLWAQVALIDDGERLGRTLTEYRRRYFTPGRQLPNGVITEWDLRPGAAQRIHRLLEDRFLSMDSAKHVTLPPVTHNVVTVPMSPTTRRVYKELKRDLVVDLEIVGGERHYAANAAILTNRLSQVTAGFMFVDDADLRGGAYDVIHHDKVSAVVEIVEGTGSPVLVFYNYLPERDMLQKALPQALTMDAPDVVARWNAGEVPVLLAHPASAGHGLNLQFGGHTVVWPTLPWSLELWEQANKRLARPGQRHPVVIHRLMSPRTVDDVKWSALTDKASVQDALMKHLESPL